MAAITSVFTIDYVAEMLGEDGEWLHELSQELERTHPVKTALRAGSRSSRL